MLKLNDNDRQEVYFLNVPYSEKDEASKLGALWDDVYRKWYVPLNLDNNQFQKWYGTTPDFNLHRSTTNNPRLYIDLVPKTSWAHNLSQQLPASDWNKIRHHIYNQANNVCEICGCTGQNGRLDAHERWFYDLKTKTQILSQISSLCPQCHMTTHMGFAKVQKKGHIAFSHLAWINLWTAEETLLHEIESFNLWKFRNQFNWETDVTFIKHLGLSLSDKTFNLLILKDDKLFLDKTKIKKISAN